MFNYLETKNIIALELCILNSDFTLAFEFLFFLSLFNHITTKLSIWCVPFLIILSTAMLSKFVLHHRFKIFTNSNHNKMTIFTFLQPQEKFALQIDTRISKSNQILLRIKIQVGISVWKHGGYSRCWAFAVLQLRHFGSMKFMMAEWNIVSWKLLRSWINCSIFT